MRYVACNKDEMRPGEIRECSVGGRKVILCCTGVETFSAVSPLCPHQGAEMIDARKLEGTTSSECVGDVKYVRCNEILRCPRHGYEFDVNTGNSLFDSKQHRLKVYSVVVEGDDVVVYLQ